MIPDLRQWDVVMVKIRETDAVAHPAVVVSDNETCTNPAALRLNVLFGTKKQPRETAGLRDVRLNSAEGLEFATLVGCGFFYVVNKDRLRERVGRVGPERRRAIARKVVEILRLPVW
jgi:hypothetical protein